MLLLRYMCAHPLGVVWCGMSDDYPKEHRLTTSGKYSWDDLRRPVPPGFDWGRLWRGAMIACGLPFVLLYAFYKACTKDN